MYSGLVVPTFQQGDDLIECINKAIAFLSTVTSRFPPSNNQLRTSSNLKNQATIQESQDTGIQDTNSSTPNDLLVLSLVKEMIDHVANLDKENQTNKWEGHMVKQCNHPNRPRSSAWFKEKLMLAKGQEAGQILDEEQLAFIADTGIAEV
nr:hypothetical protein [Tanacetum cinerariifolium]